MNLRLLILSYFLISNLVAQDTFSIVAVDENTGEVGSAGASCVEGAANFGGVILISGIIPGRGGINAQANICIPHSNLNLGIAQMQAGSAPQVILDYLYINDGCNFGNNEDRQYGIVDFDAGGNARAAAFTGSTTLAYAGQRVGDDYAIQGNILLGPQILDNMEQAFLNTSGALAERLMAAMQGANVAGADSRCLAAGTSSTSAFLQVFRPEDSPNNPYLRLNVTETATGVEPIDSLQSLFDNWITTGTASIPDQIELSIYPNPAGNWFQIEVEEKELPLTMELFNESGQQVYQKNIQNNLHRIQTDFVTDQGVFFYKFKNRSGKMVSSGKIVIEK